MSLSAERVRWTSSFISRCVARRPIGVVSTPVVGIRKHAANFSADPLVNTLGEIDVLKYVLAHNPAAARVKRLILDQITNRTAQAAEHSFDIGDLPKSRELMRPVTLRHRSARQMVKALIASLPDKAGSVLRQTSLAIAARQHDRSRVT
jgi:hypothetical protein